MNKWDEDRFNFYNEILELCLFDFKNTCEIFPLRPEKSRYNVFNVINMLVKYGYLEKSTNGNHACFRSLKPYMKNSEYVPYQENMIARFEKEEVSYIDKQLMKKNENLRIIRPDDTLKEKHRETSRMDRNNRKSPKVYVGCSFAMMI